jgi:hypothetical protein
MGSKDFSGRRPDSYQPSGNALGNARQHILRRPAACLIPRNTIRASTTQEVGKLEKRAGEATLFLKLL